MAADCGASMSAEPYTRYVAQLRRALADARAAVDRIIATIRSWPTQPIAIGVLTLGVLISTIAGLFKGIGDHHGRSFVAGTFAADSAAELEQLLAVGALDLDAIRRGDQPVPPLLLAALPPDLAGGAGDERRHLFLSAVLPLVLQANEEILADRRRLLRLAENPVRPAATAPDDWLTELADRYGGDPADLEDLLGRVDTISPAVALAQAAQESGWGGSRFALEGNALFGQRIWRAGPGLSPSRSNSDRFAVRSFPTLLDSVRAYAHNLNSHQAYAPFRQYRAEMRARNRRVDAIRAAGTLEAYSEEGPAYVDALIAVIRDNRLTELDAAELR